MRWPSEHQSTLWQAPQKTKYRSFAAAASGTGEYGHRSHEPSWNGGLPGHAARSAQTGLQLRMRLVETQGFQVSRPGSLRHRASFVPPQTGPACSDTGTASLVQESEVRGGIRGRQGGRVGTWWP